MASPAIQALFASVENAIPTMPAVRHRSPGRYERPDVEAGLKPKKMTPLTTEKLDGRGDNDADAKNYKNVATASNMGPAP